MQLFSRDFRLLRLASGHIYELNEEPLSPDSRCFGGDSGDQVARKRLTFVRCTAKLLNSCGSKQKNFLATHRSELRASIKDMMETIELVNLRG